METSRSLGEMESTESPVRTVAEPSARTSPKRRLRVAYAITGALAAMLVLVVLTNGRWARSESDLDRAMRELVVAVGPSRPTVARLSAPFGWSPPPGVVRGGENRVDLSPAATIAAAKIVQAAQTERTAQTLQALGTAQLVLGRIDSAVSTLEAATRLKPDAAAIWADLSAAYYERSAAPDGATNLPKGLEAANTAIALGGADRAAWFNKALLLERLKTRDQAIAAWKHYLELDGQSPWADEARQRLAALEKRPAATTVPDVQRQRDALLDDVLKRWADRTLQRDIGGAAAALAEARRLTDEISRTAGDRLAADIVGSISSASAASALRLAAGHADYGVARVMYSRHEYDDAARRFAQALRDFEATGSAAAYPARLNLGTIRYRQNDFAGAVTALRSLRSETERRSYPSVTGRAMWVEGVALEFSGFAHQAAERYTAASGLLMDAAEPGHAAFVNGLLASQLDRLGDPDRAWNIWVRSFEASGREGTLLTAAISASRLGWHRTALDLQVAATESARTGGRDASVADGLRWQAITNTRLRRGAETRSRIDEARAIVRGRTGAAWDRMRAEIDLAEADSGEASPADARIAAATRALTYFRGASASARLPAILLARATARLATADVDGAHSDLTEGTRILGELREQVAPGIDQVRFSDVVRRVVATLVDVEDRRGRLADAFEVIEDTRGRDLPDASAPLTLHELERRLPPATALIAFVVGDERSYAWLVRPGWSKVVRIAAGRPVLEQLAEGVSSPRFDREAASQLRRLLLEQVLDTVPPDTLLVIVPDGPLHTVPFAALPGTRATYLIEEHPIVVTPSARSWLLASTRLPQMPSTGMRAFVAGNPRVDQRRYGDLPHLGAAEEEAHAVAALYRTTPLTGADVTRTAVVAALDADVLHFAGHALVNDVHPALSSLVVWDPDGPGLSAGVIRSHDWSRARLVVLAACRSSSGAQTRTEGPISLARAFLSGGASSVVASLWMIDDRASKELLVRFHRTYLATGDPAAALRTAQLGLIHSAESALRFPSSWAGWVAIGATALPVQPAATH